MTSQPYMQELTDKSAGSLLIQHQSCCTCSLMTVTDILVMSSAESESVEAAPGGQPQGPFEVCLQYSGPAVLLWLWSNAHSSEDTGLKAQPIKHTAGNTGQSTSHCFATVISMLS